MDQVPVSLASFLSKLRPNLKLEQGKSGLEYTEALAQAIVLAGATPRIDLEETADLLADHFPDVEPFLLAIPIWTHNGQTLLQLSVTSGVPEMTARIVYLSQLGQDFDSHGLIAQKNGLLSRPDNSGNTLLHSLCELANTKSSTAVKWLWTFFTDKLYFSMFRPSLPYRLTVTNAAGLTPLQMCDDPYFHKQMDMLLKLPDTEKGPLFVRSFDEAEVKVKTQKPELLAELPQLFAAYQSQKNKEKQQSEDVLFVEAEAEAEADLEVLGEEKEDCQGQDLEEETQTGEKEYTPLGFARTQGDQATRAVLLDMLL